MIALIVLALLILINAFFAASEIAFISLNDNKIRMNAEAGNKKAKQLYELLKEPSRFLATIQIGITLAGFMASAFAADSFSDQLAQAARQWGAPLPLATLDTIAMILITLILSYFTLVFGELVPKRLGMKKANAIAHVAVTPIRMLSIITAPFVKLLTLSTNLLVRLFGFDPHEDDEEVTEEEIRMMVDVGKQRGAILETEQIMIDNIFEFNNKTVSDIMTHRTHIVALPKEASLKEIIDLINHTQYTRYPVFDERIDQIIGILHVKAMMPYLNNCDEHTFQLEKLLLRPYQVPISKRTDELLRDLQTNKTHMAVVIDEYGGTAGIVTIEDLIEEIVGNIFDEYDEDSNAIIQVDPYTFLMDGLVMLDEAEEVLHLGLPLDEYDTLNGFLIGQLGRLPKRGETLDIPYKDAVFTITEAAERRIDQVRVELNRQ